MQNIEIIHLLEYRGPNIWSPYPGVMLRIASSTNQSDALKHALKESAQRIGLIVAHVDVETIQDHQRAISTVTYTTPDPAMGTALMHYVVAGLAAQAAEDDEWDEETPLFEMQQRMRQCRLSHAALQLMTEAQKRDIPAFRCTDGAIQIGYGERSWTCDPATISEDAPPQPTWENIGTIPIYAISGEKHRRKWVDWVAQQLADRGEPATVLHDASYDETLVALSDTCTQRLVVGLATSGLVEHGLAFRHCCMSIVTDMDGEQPFACANRDEWLRALGIPALVTTGGVVLNMQDADIAHLADYAQQGVVELEQAHTVV